MRGGSQFSAPWDYTDKDGNNNYHETLNNAIALYEEEFAKNNLRQKGWGLMEPNPSVSRAESYPEEQRLLLAVRKIDRDYLPPM